jgi:hypothetical protein
LAELCDMHLKHGGTDERLCVYQEQFPVRPQPKNSTVPSIEMRLREHCSLATSMHLTGRPRADRTSDPEEVILYLVPADRSTSCRRTAQTVGAVACVASVTPAAATRFPYASLDCQQLSALCSFLPVVPSAPLKTPFCQQFNAHWWGTYLQRMATSVHSRCTYGNN